MAIERMSGEKKTITLEDLDAVLGARGAVNLIFSELRREVIKAISDKEDEEAGELPESLRDRKAIVKFIERRTKRELDRLSSYGFKLSAVGVVELLPRVIAESDVILDGSIKTARREGREGDAKKFKQLKKANALLLSGLKKSHNSVVK